MLSVDLVIFSKKWKTKKLASSKNGPKFHRGEHLLGRMAKGGESVQNTESQSQNSLRVLYLYHDLFPFFPSPFVDSPLFLVIILILASPPPSDINPFFF